MSASLYSWDANVQDLGARLTSSPHHTACSYIVVFPPANLPEPPSHLVVNLEPEDNSVTAQALGKCITKNEWSAEDLIRHFARRIVEDHRTNDISGPSSQLLSQAQGKRRFEGARRVVRLGWLEACADRVKLVEDDSHGGWEVK